VSPWLVESVVRVSVLVVVALVACARLSSSSAALRHWVLTVTLGCAVVTPPLAAVFPSWLTAPIGFRHFPAHVGEADRVAKEPPGRADPADAAGVDTTFSAAVVPLATRGQSDHPWLLVTWGSRHPAILLPKGASEWSDERIRVVLNTTLSRHPLSWKTRLVAPVALLALTVAGAALQAQSQFYSLSGAVLDPSGRVLPDTTLVLTNPSTASKYEVRSDATGRFQFVGLPPSAYQLKASLPGFALVSEPIQILRHVERDVRMRLGSLQETITVTDQPVPKPRVDLAMEQKLEDARRRFAEFLQQQLASCAIGSRDGAVGGNILQPRKLVDVRPVFPEHLKDAKVGGTVTMEALIGIDGLIRDVQNLAGPDPALEAAAVDAVRQWQFSPTLLNCEPTEVELHVTTYFRIQP